MRDLEKSVSGVVPTHAQPERIHSSVNRAAKDPVASPRGQEAFQGAAIVLEAAEMEGAVRVLELAAEARASEDKRISTQVRIMFTKRGSLTL